MHSQSSFFQEAHPIGETSTVLFFDFSPLDFSPLDFATGPAVPHPNPGPQQGSFYQDVSDTAFVVIAQNG